MEENVQSSLVSYQNLGAAQLPVSRCVGKGDVACPHYGIPLGHKAEQDAEESRNSSAGGRSGGSVHVLCPADGTLENTSSRSPGSAP